MSLATCFANSITSSLVYISSYTISSYSSSKVILNMLNKSVNKNFSLVLNSLYFLYGKRLIFLFNNLNDKTSLRLPVNTSS